jgi:hypothetical protein
MSKVPRDYVVRIGIRTGRANRALHSSSEHRASRARLRCSRFSRLPQFMRKVLSSQIKRQISRMLRSMVLITESILPDSTCLARLMV